MPTIACPTPHRASRFPVTGSCYGTRGQKGKRRCGAREREHVLLAGSRQPRLMVRVPAVLRALTLSSPHSKKICMNAHITHTDPSVQTATLSTVANNLDRLHALATARIFSHMAQSMRSGDVSFSQVTVLFRLYGQGPQRIADLAAAAHLSQCAASRLVSRLEQEGLVVKQQCVNRRERHISLTPVGISFLKQLQQQTATAYKDLLSHIPAHLIQQLLQGLEAIMPFLSPHELSS